MPHMEKSVKKMIVITCYDWAGETYKVDSDCADIAIGVCIVLHRK